MANEKTADLDYKAYYHKDQEEIACLKMKLVDSEEEYTAKAEDGTEYYVRLLIAYKTDIVEYEIGYYDGYKWMTEMPIRLIKDVVAWMPFPNMPQPPKYAESKIMTRGNDYDLSRV